MLKENGYVIHFERSSRLPGYYTWDAELNSKFTTSQLYLRQATECLTLSTLSRDK